MALIYAKLEALQAKETNHFKVEAKIHMTSVFRVFR